MSDNHGDNDGRPQQQGINSARDGGGRFVPGRSGHPGGRPKGSRDSAWLMRITLEALDRVGGVEWLLEQAEKRPAAFLQFVNRMLPTKAETSTSGATLTDLVDELRRLSDIRAEERRAELAQAEGLAELRRLAPPADPRPDVR